MSQPSTNSNLSYSPEMPNSGQNQCFLSCVTIKCDRWPKTIRELFYPTSSFVHHFVASGQFKLELQSENARFWSKSAILLSHVTLEFEGWPRKTMRRLSHVTSSFVHHCTAISEFKHELHSGNAQLESKLASFCPVWPWNLTNDIEKQ